MAMLSRELVRKFWILLWSWIRCMMSPVIFVSKNAIGRRISFERKSEMSEMLTRAVT